MANLKDLDKKWGGEKEKMEQAAHTGTKNSAASLKDLDEKWGKPKKEKQPTQYEAKRKANTGTYQETENTARQKAIDKMEKEREQNAKPGEYLNGNAGIRQGAGSYGAMGQSKNWTGSAEEKRTAPEYVTARERIAETGNYRMPEKKGDGNAEYLAKSFGTGMVSELANVENQMINFAQMGNQGKRAWNDFVAAQRENEQTKQQQSMTGTGDIVPESRKEMETVVPAMDDRSRENRMMDQQNRALETLRNTDLVPTGYERDENGKLVPTGESIDELGRSAQNYQQSQNKTGLVKLAGDVATSNGGMAADILMGAAGGEAASLVTMFLAAAGAQTQQAKEEGADFGTANLAGLMVGAKEVLTEKMFDGIPGMDGVQYASVSSAIDKGINKYFKTATGKRVANRLINTVGEGAEEYIGDVMESYITQLYKEDDRSLLQRLEDPDAWYSFLTGGLMGIALSGPVDVANDIQARDTGRSLREVGQEDAVLQAAETGEGEAAEMAKTMRNQQSAGKNYTDTDLGYLYSKMSEDQREQASRNAKEMEDRNREVRENLAGEAGNTETVEASMQGNAAMADQAQKITQAQNDPEEAARRIDRETRPGNTEAQRPYMEQSGGETQMNNAEILAQIAMERSQAQQGAMEKSPAGEGNLAQIAVERSEIQQARTDNGAAAREEIAGMAMTGNYSQEMKDLLNSSYTGGSVSVYEKAMDGMYRAGRTGLMSYEQALKGNRSMAAMVENQNALRKAYEAGAAAAQTVKETAAGAAGNIGVQYEGETAQNSQVPTELMQATAEKLGIDIRVVEKLGDGEGGAANGAWAAGISQMILGNNSSNQYQTMQHEITHYMSSKNPEGAKRLESMVLEFYAGEKGMDALTELSEQYQKVYGEESLSADELARDLWSGIMSTEEGTRAFCEYIAESDAHNEEKKTVLKTLKELLDKIVEKVRNLLKGGDATLGAAEGRTLSEREELAEKQSAMIEEYLKELDAARKNDRKSGEEKDVQVKQETKAAEEMKFSKHVTAEEMHNLEAAVDKAFYEGYRVFGIRVVDDESNILKVGDSVPDSYGWDYDEDVSTRETTGEKLPGACAIEIKTDTIFPMEEEDYERLGERIEEALKESNGYYGNQTILIGGKGNREYGMDPGEIIIEDADVIAVLDGKKFSKSTETEALKKENSKMEQKISEMEDQIRILKEETKLSGGHVMDKKAVKKAAWKLLQKYESKYDRGTFEQEIEKLFEQIANDPDMSGEQAMSACTALMKDVLKESERANTEAYEAYKPVRDTLRRMKFRVKKDSPEYFELLNAYGDGIDGRKWGNVRKRLYGKLDISLTEGAGNIDTQIMTLDESYPWVFDAEKDTVSNIDAALAVFEGSRIEYENPYGMDLDGAAADAGQDLYEAYMDTPERHTYADKQQQKAILLKGEFRKNKQEALDKQKERYERKLKMVRQENEERMRSLQKKLEEAGKEKNDEIAEKYQKQIEELRRKSTEKMLEQRAAFQDRLEKRNEGLEWRTARDGVQKNVRKLQKWLENPTDQAYVQDSMKGATLELLNAFDWNTSREGTNASQRWREAMKDFRSMAADMERANGGEDAEWVDFDPDLPAMIDELVAGAKDVKGIGTLDANQMKQLNNILESAAHSITQANKMMAQKNSETVQRMGDATVSELKKAKKAQARNRNALLKKGMNTKIADVIDGVTGLDMMDAGRYFTSLGETAREIYKPIRNGFDTRVWKLKSAQKYMEGVLNGKDIKKWTGDKAEKHEFTLHSDAFDKDTKLTMTTGQIMELYCLSQRQQAKEHLMQGGISLDLGNGRKGQRVNLTAQQLAEIVGTLTPEQVEVANKMRKYLSTEVAEWGNEVSMKQYGTRKFTERDYWPIRTDANFTRTSDASENSGALYGIKNQGFTKQVQKKANNPVIIHDAFDTWSEHVANMATYNAWCIPLSDAMKWYNYKSEQGSVKEQIEELYGKKGKTYFVNLMKDINGASGKTNQTSTERIMGRFVTPWKVAKVGNNLRVAIQQPTAYLRAGMVLSPKSLTAALAKTPMECRRGMKMAEEHCAIAQWKSWGYFETNIGKNMKSILTGQQSFVENLQEKSTAMAEMGDKVTWGTLWLACEEEVKRENPKIDAKSEEFIQRTSEKLSEVIDKTQVVDSVLHRSQVMRSQNQLVQMEMNFMAEPTKTWAMMREAFVDAVQQKPGAKKKLARAMATYVVTALGTAAAASLMDAMRVSADDRDKDWEERYMDALIENFKDGLNLINNLPIVKDIMSMAEGYDVERTDMAAFSDFFSAVSAWQKTLAGTGKATPYQLMYKTANVLSEVSGIPIGNAIREIKSAYDVLTKMQDPLRIDEAVNKSSQDVNRAIKKGEMEYAQELVDKLVEEKMEAGKTEKEARSAIKSSLTSYWKPVYLEAGKEEQKKIREKLMNVKVKGKEVYTNKDFENWMK